MVPLPLNRVASWRELFAPADYCTVGEGPGAGVVIVCPRCRGWIVIREGILKLEPLTIAQQIVHWMYQCRFDVKEGKILL